jgi:hypothetical protein
MQEPPEGGVVAGHVTQVGLLEQGHGRQSRFADRFRPDLMA